MAGVLGQWSNGPIQFNSNNGGIESRGTIDKPPPSAVNPTPITAAAPDGGGSLFNSDTLPYTPGAGGWGGDSGGYGPAHTAGDGSGWSSGYGAAHTVGDGSGFGANNTDGNLSLAFDDGGEVDDNDEDDGTGEQGAASATLDPMQAIKATLAYGRKKFGLPQNFSTGDEDQQQSYADGGEVDEGNGGVIPDPESQDGNDVTAGGNKAADPRQTMMYLTGTGNISPDIAGALEKHVDPDGTMDPSDRAAKAIASAPSPEASFGVMQHYRTKFNAYSAGAKAALDQGNLAQAAAHATQAYGAVPSGYSVKFAPAPGGIAVQAQKHGAQPKGYSDGGIVDNEDLPESDNIEDRRNETDEGWAAKDDGPTPEGAGTGAIQAYADSQKRTKQAGEDDEGVIKKVKSFDDGGEVDDDDTVQPPVDNQDEGVLQMEQPQEPSGPSEGTPADAEDQSAGEDQGGQPQILTPEQFKALMDSGYDKPLDDGVPNVLGNVLGPLMKGDFSGAAQGLKQNVGNLFTKPGPSPEQSAALADDDGGAMNATQTQGAPQGQPSMRAAQHSRPTPQAQQATPVDDYPDDLPEQPGGVQKVSGPSEDPANLPGGVDYTGPGSRAARNKAYEDGANARTPNGKTVMSGFGGGGPAEPNGQGGWSLLKGHDDAFRVSPEQVLEKRNAAAGAPSADTPRPNAPQRRQAQAAAPQPPAGDEAAPQRANPGSQTGPQQTTVGKTNGPGSSGRGDRLTSANGDKVPVTEEDKARWRARIDPDIARQDRQSQADDAAFERVSKVANKLFPMASQERQRQQYVQRALQQYQVQQGQQDLERTRNRAGIEQSKEQARQNLELFKQTAITGRNENSVGQKRDASAAGIASRERNVDVQQLNAKLRTDMINFPKATLEERAKRIGTTVQDLMGAAQGSQQRGGGQPQGGGGQSQGGGGSQSIKFYKGQWYSRGPNGEAVPVAAPR